MDQLFGSKTRVKLLQLFATNPNRPFYVREITRKVDEQINSVRRELANLLNIGIVSSTTESEGNRLYYEVNQNYPHYKALRAMFAGEAIDSGVVKASDKDTQSKLKELGAVELLIYLGSFTGDNLSNVDVVIVGDVNQTKVGHYMAELEAEEGRELRYTTMPLSEYRYRQQIKDRFVTIVDGAKKTVIHDPHGLYSKPVAAKKAAPKKDSKAKTTKTKKGKK